MSSLHQSAVAPIRIPPVATGGLLMSSLYQSAIAPLRIPPVATGGLLMSSLYQISNCSPSNPAGGNRRIVKVQPIPISNCSPSNPAGGNRRIVKVQPIKSSKVLQLEPHPCHTPILLTPAYMRLAHSFEGRFGADYSSIDILSNTDLFFYLRFSAYFCG